MLCLLQQLWHLLCVRQLGLRCFRVNHYLLDSYLSMLPALIAYRADAMKEEVNSHAS